VSLQYEKRARLTDRNAVAAALLPPVLVSRSSVGVAAAH